MHGIFLRVLGAIAITWALAATSVDSRADEPLDPRTVVFLDNAQGVQNGSTTYDPETRTSGKGKYKVFSDISQAAKALASADTLYVRAGTYSRESVGQSIAVHGNQVSYWTGSLAINATGTPERRKLVSAYKDELAIIQAKPGVSNYNPDPADTNFKQSSHYYPHPAISIGGAYVDVVGFKTYGQVVLTGHDNTVQECDLGGGGPHTNQGQVIMIHSAYNVTVRNNKIHHSCWGESAINGAATMGYAFAATIEHNEFYDNYGPDIRIKDCRGRQAYDTIIRFNVFRPTTTNPKGNAGVLGIGQYGEIRRIQIHNNLFLRKSEGISWDSSAMEGTLAFNNTFVDCNCDVGTWLNPAVHVSNNLHYHSRAGQSFYSFQANPLGNLQSDRNMFFSTAGDTRWENLYRPRGTSLDAWRGYFGGDKNSVWKDPPFLNPTGNRPEDFKRKDPKAIQDVDGSPYGPVCGAYVTGDENVGIVPGSRVGTNP